MPSTVEIEQLNAFVERIDYLREEFPHMTQEGLIALVSAFERGRLADELAALNDIVREKA